MGPGKMIPMPTIIHPDNEKEYEHSREEKGKEKKITKVKWEKTKVKEGEEVGFSAQVENIAEGNMLTIQVLSQASSPEDGFVYSRYPLTIQQGKVSARWKYEANKEDIPAERNPSFIISAHSAWCAYKISENSLEVELRRPKIEKLEWKDTEGKAASKGTVGTPIKLYCEVTEFEEGQGLTFTVYNARTQAEVTGIGAEVKDGKAEAQWTYHWDGEPLEEKPKYYFEVTANRCKPVKSTEVEIGAKINCRITDIFENINKDLSYSLLNEEGKIQDGKIDSDGNIKVDDLIPGNIYLLLSSESENELETLSGKYSDKKNVIKISASELDKYKIKIDLTLENLIIIDPDTAPVSF